MKSFLRRAALAFGVANLYMLGLTGPLISPDHELVFHYMGAGALLFLPVMLDVLVVWLLLVLALHLVRGRGRMELLVWAAMLGILPWVLLRTTSYFSGIAIRPWINNLALALTLGGGAYLVYKGRAPLKIFHRLKPLVATIGGFVALTGILIMAELIFYGWQARGSWRDAPLHVSSAAMPVRTTKTRVVVVLLDELSYQQIYEHRFAGLGLPAFDRLGAEATVFTHAIPAAEFTRVAIPSLLTGDPVDRTRQGANGHSLTIHREDAREWDPLTGGDTLFGDAIRSGYRTGVAGWYEPYCRMLPNVLDRCFWAYSDAIPGDMSSDRTLLGNMVTPAIEEGARVLHWAHLGPGPARDDVRDVRRHAADFRSLMAAGDSLLRDQTIGLVWLHMPIPHPWGFFDRRDGSFPDHQTSYVDNLALADKYMAHVREVLERAGQWDSSCVIVMGDHSWRTSFVWSESAHWTDEDEAASQGGQYDERPAYIVKLAGQKVGARVETEYRADATRKLVDGVMRGRMTSAAELKAWAARQQ